MSANHRPSKSANEPAAPAAAAPCVLSLVLPCRNQADHIGEVIPRYFAPLDSLGIAYEIIMVPNASTDATEEVVQAIAATDPRVRVVVNPAGGWGLSVRMGLDAARGSILAYTNTARTDPESLPEFIRLYQASGGMVKARREARQAPLREFGSLVYNLEAWVCFGVRTSDVNGTPKIFPKTFYDDAAPTSDGDLIDLELMVRATEQQLPLSEITVRGFKRHGGKSSTNFTSAWNMYAGALGLWMQRGRAAKRPSRAA